MYIYISADIILLAIFYIIIARYTTHFASVKAYIYIIHAVYIGFVLTISWLECMSFHCLENKSVRLTKTSRTFPKFHQCSLAIYLSAVPLCLPARW